MALGIAHVKNSKDSMERLVDVETVKALFTLGPNSLRRLEVNGRKWEVGVWTPLL